jgi:RNA polymerase sigma-70 factor (ECF subfamily)
MRVGMAFGTESDSERARPDVVVLPSHAKNVGSSVVLERLYRQHWRDICRRLRRIYGNGPPEPEDLAQAAFEKFAQLEDHERILHPRAFLIRIATNLGLNAIDRIRTARRFVERELVEACEPVVEENTPEDVYSLRERMALVEKAMSRLTDKQKEILVRSRFRGETYAQIGEETGWSQADISRQLNAALAILQQAMASGEE